MHVRTPVSEQIFGANKAPLDEVLKTDFADLWKEATDLALEVKSRPAKIKDEADFAATGALSIRVKTLSDKIEATRKTETDPLFQTQKAIKAYFDTFLETLATELGPHTVAANTYTRERIAREKREREEAGQKLRDKEAAERKKAEGTGVGAARAEGRADALAAQADQLATPVSVATIMQTKISGGGKASASTAWKFEITDYDKIDLEKLRPFLSRDAVETAIRSCVRVQKGNATITGVRVYEDVQATFRK